MSMTQKEMLRWHLENVGEIDPQTALREYGIMRLASRICDLRREGMEIETEWRVSVNKFGKRTPYGVYRLAK